MNKIIIDTNEYNLEVHEDLYLDIRSDSIINFSIKNFHKNNIIILNKSNNITINLEMYDNTNIEINSLGINSNINYNIVQNNNSNLYIVSSIISKVDSINNISINHIGNNNKTIFYTNGINLDKNKLYFNINGIINKKLINNYLDENSKIINMSDGESLIIPNLIIDTKEIVANHSAYIGNFTNSDLYYLMSRGISREDSCRLLIKSLLLSNMNLDTKIFIKEISDFIGIGGEEFE